jgi:hypothetical protein
MDDGPLNSPRRGAVQPGLRIHGDFAQVARLCLSKVCSSTHLSQGEQIVLEDALLGANDGLLILRNSIFLSSWPVSSRPRPSFPACRDSRRGRTAILNSYFRQYSPPSISSSCR